MRPLIVVLMALVLAALGLAAFSAVAMRTTGHAYDVPRVTSNALGASAAEGQVIRDSGAPARRAHHTYDDDSNLARTNARLDDYRKAPNTTRLAE